MANGLLNRPDVPFQGQQVSDVMRARAGAASKPWQYYTGPHVASGIESLGKVGIGLADFISPHADAKDFTEFSKKSGDAFMAGDFPQGLSNLGMAGAALGMTMVPGSIGGIKKATDTAVEEGPGFLSRMKTNLKKRLKTDQKSDLSEVELEKLALAEQSSPGFKKAAQYMLPGELKTVLNNPRGVEQVSRLLDVLPSAKNAAATAKFGAPKRGWYDASAKALVDVFESPGVVGRQPGDATRFATLLAATSPQNSVEMNLMNTLNIWRVWTRAGRPTDPKAIKAVMGESVAGSKGEASVLDAWVNNSVRALTTKDPSKTVLSGPKVDSFYRNLVGDTLRVTNDAHMANWSGISQDILRQSPSPAQLAAGNPGFSPAYAGMSSRVREGASDVGFTPAEGQETIWSVAMPLNEMQAKLNLPAREILQRGLLKPDDIRGTPDFSTLLKDPEYRGILESSGYGDAVAGMKPHRWPDKTPDLSLSEQREMTKTAERLEQLRDLRGREKEARAVVSRKAPKSATVYSTAEAVPGEGTDHLPGLLNAPPGTQRQFTGRVASAFTDPQGLDVLHKNVGLAPIKTRPMQGAYQATPQSPIEFNPGYAAGIRSRLVGGKKPHITAKDEQRLRTAATVRGGMTGQLETPYHGLIKDAKGTDAFMPRSKKLSEPAIRDFVKKHGIEDQAIADVGEGVGILNWTGKPYSRKQLDSMGEALGETAPGAKVEPAVAARNVTDIDNSNIDLSKEWKQPPGSRQVTQRMMDELDQLSAKDLKQLDGREIRLAATDLEAVYQAQAKKGEPVREDLMNMLSIIKDKGLTGLRAALGAKAFLPSLAAIGLAPTVYQLSSQGEERSSGRSPL